MQFHVSFSNMLAAVLLQHASWSPFLSAQGDTLVKVFHFFLEPRGYPKKWIYHFNIQLKCTSSHLNQLFNVDLQQNGPTHKMCRETIWDPKNDARLNDFLVLDRWPGHSTIVASWSWVACVATVVGAERGAWKLWCICIDIIFWCFFVSFLLVCCNDIFWPIFLGGGGLMMCLGGWILGSLWAKGFTKIAGHQIWWRRLTLKEERITVSQEFFFARSFFLLLLLLLLFLLLFKAWFCCTQGEASAKSCWTFSRSIAGSYTSGRELSDLKIATAFGEFCWEASEFGGTSYQFQRLEVWIQYV